MTISFNSIPANLRVPAVLVEFDNSRGNQGVAAQDHTILVIGQRDATSATVASGVPTLVTGADQAETYFGRGSMLAAMFKALKGANRFTRTIALAANENGAGVAATGKLTVTGAATASGTVVLYVAGERITVGVTSGAAPTTVATAIQAAIAARNDLPVTAAVNGTNANEVDLTCRWKGETGNGIDLRLNYYQGERLPAGVAVAVTAMAGGTANPDLATTIAAMGDTPYHTIVMPFTDAAGLTALEAELSSRSAPPRMIGGMAFAAYRGTPAASVTFGGGRNSQFVCCMGTGIAPQPPYLWAAVTAGAAAEAVSADPARPLQTLPLTGLLPQADADQWTLDERNLALYDGIATHNVVAGVAQVERLITMYQVNGSNVPDPSYLDITTHYTLAAIRAAVRARVTQRFPRHKLADDGTRARPGQAIATPSIIRNELLALFRELEDIGLVENFEQFKAELVVERNQGDPNRVDVLFPPDLVNGLMIVAAAIQFRV